MLKHSKGWKTKENTPSDGYEAWKQGQGQKKMSKE